MDTEELSNRLYGEIERLGQSIQWLIERLDQLEYRKVNDIKNDVYGLERELDSVKRDISSLENQVRYR